MANGRKYKSSVVIIKCIWSLNSCTENLKTNRLLRITRRKLHYLINYSPTINQSVQHWTDLGRVSTSRSWWNASTARWSYISQQFRRCLSSVNWLYSLLSLSIYSFFSTIFYNAQITINQSACAQPSKTTTMTTMHGENSIKTSRKTAQNNQ